MSIEELISRYVASAEHAFGELEVAGVCMNLEANNIKRVVEFAKAYLEDAKYYKDKKKFEVSLASVAYCEGLLDALRLLGAVRFEWPLKMKEEKGEK